MPALAFHTLDDLNLTAPVFVRFSYYGRHYVGKIVTLAARTMVVSWRLRNGRVVERRVPLGFTKRRYAECELPTLGYDSRDAVTKAVTAFDTYNALINAAS